VCGLIRGSRGYNLIGEVIDHSKLIDYIKKAIINALNNLEPVTVSFNTKSISEVKVIGEEQINELTTLADKTTEKVKRVALILFPVASVLLTLIFLFLT
jgi:predicted neutral ceramidase superfamily lipid hydrolase